MALSPSPQLSPSMGGGQRLDGQPRSDTPPAQPQSKRDKRRTLLLDRLNEITQHFNNNKDQFYRNQLQAIQVDTGLILHADPHRHNPLSDFGDEVQEMICNATNLNPQAMIAVHNRDVSSIAGKLYSEFANEVNTAMEERDVSLTIHRREHERKLAELHTQNAFMIKLAEEEHKALASTLRDRLINSATGKKIKLNKEKDDLLNIGESNALLMHPNQYTIVNPSSPGGMHNKRATRHRRDIDDIPAFPDSYKRKRKAADDVGSPAPTRRHLENGFSTPIWTSEQVARAANKGSTSPLYSVDKLFTEKELAMTYNSAALAARIYVLTHDPEKNGDSNNESESPPSNEGEGQKAGDADQENYGADSPPTAPAMDRQFSHATRSTRGAIGLGIGSYTTATGIDIISDSSAQGSFLRMAAQLPKMPPLLHTVMLKAYSRDAPNSPTGIGPDELNLDLHNIERAQRANENNGAGRSLEYDREMLTAAVAEPGKYPAWLTTEKMDNATKSNAAKMARTAAAAAAAGLGGLGVDDGQGGVPMSKQSSMGGGSEAGGVAMSRSGTGQGEPASGGTSLQMGGGGGKRRGRAAAAPAA